MNARAWQQLELVARPPRRRRTGRLSDRQTRVLALCAQRPRTAAEVAQALELDQPSAAVTITSLLQRRRLEATTIGGTLHYQRAPMTPLP